MRPTDHSLVARRRPTLAPRRDRPRGRQIAASQPIGLDRAEREEVDIDQPSGEAVQNGRNPRPAGSMSIATSLRFLAGNRRTDRCRPHRQQSGTACSRTATRRERSAPSSPAKNSNAATDAHHKSQPPLSCFSPVRDVSNRKQAQRRHRQPADGDQGSRHAAGGIKDARQIKNRRHSGWPKDGPLRQRDRPGCPPSAFSHRWQYGPRSPRPQRSPPPRSRAPATEQDCQEVEPPNQREMVEKCLNQYQEHSTGYPRGQRCVDELLPSGRSSTAAFGMPTTPSGRQRPRRAAESWASSGS